MLQWNKEYLNTFCTHYMSYFHKWRITAINIVLHLYVSV